MPDPDWSDFKVLLALSRGGSVAAAARILGVDGSTISRRLAAAEEAMGATLIVRGGREFSFTAEGQAALGAAQAMETAVNAAAASVRTAKTALQGIVKIACQPSAIYFLMPFQDIVAQTHPGLGVELVSGRAAVDLAKGDADIGIRNTRPTDLDLVVRYSFTWGSCVYAAERYLETHGRPATHADVARHMLVRYHQSFLHLPAIAWIEQFADPAQPAIRADSIDMARSLIASGGGIGSLLCTIGDTTPGVVRVFEEPIEQTQCWIVYHSTSRGSARIKAVLDLLIAYYVERRDELSGHRAKP